MNAYIEIARPDHWFKNVFMLPGMAFAFILAPVSVTTILLPVAIGFISTCLIASANYTINEYLDAQFDRHHPVKKNRPAVKGEIEFPYVLIQYLVLATVGLSLAWFVGKQFTVTTGIFLLMGILYNMSPFRTKDRQYLDVLSESVNNPLRLVLGWSAIVHTALPPSSIVLSYWMGGAFLMAVKRYAEYRHIGDQTIAGAYRRSFRFYTEETLLISSFFYALISVFFLGIFLIKYRIEFLLTFPLFALLFTWYLHIGIKENSPAQTPEKLFNERLFMVYVVALTLIVIALFFIDIPVLSVLLDPIEYARH